jgi:uncharacterized protein (TIGR03437 family)
VPFDFQLTDTCGAPVTNNYPASVSVSFGLGEQAITMQHISNGKWTKTWQPQSTQPTTLTATFSLLATGPNLKPLNRQWTLPITLVSGAPVPLIKQGKIQNAASFAADAVVAPGSIIAVQGNLLADSAPQLSTTGPWPTSLGHTQVKLGDRALPLYYTSSGQLNAQVPFDLQENAQLQLVVQRDDAISVPASVSVASAQPAIFTTNFQGFGQGAIVNGVTNLFADSTNPVKVGDVISIYCTGLGAVSPPVQEGQPASNTTLSRTTNTVTVSIGGIPAKVDFAGMAPGFIGLYQVNAFIPTGVAPGDSVPVVLTEGTQVSNTATIVVR